MDSVRGTAILLLLIWHASAVPEFFGTPMPDALRSANSFFFPFRMPTLMLLSGMLLTRSLSKPITTYYAGKFAIVLWPYLVWVVIAKIVFLEMPGVPWWHWHAWYSTSYLWFLFFIGVFYAVAPLFAHLRATGPISRALQFLGRSSLVFYVSHFPVMALVSKSPLADGSFLQLILLNLVASLLIGSALTACKNTPPTVWLFPAPGALTAWITRALRLLVR